MKTIKSLILCLFLALSTVTYAHDWNCCSLSGGAEFVTDYNWRGTNVGGISVQPWVEFSAYGFNVGVWSSLGSGIHDKDYFREFNPELDLYISYTTPDEHFTLGLTHYYYFDDQFFNYSYDLTKVGTTQSEISVNFLVSEDYPFEFGAAMMFGGGDCYQLYDEYLITTPDGNPQKLYSTYIYLKYTLELGDVTLVPEVGLSPHKSMYTYYDPITGYHHNFAFNNLSCTAYWNFYESKLVSMYCTGNFFLNFFDTCFRPFEYGKNACVSVGLGIEL
jgi:hypothetical protein